MHSIGTLRRLQAFLLTSTLAGVIGFVCMPDARTRAEPSEGGAAQTEGEGPATLREARGRAKLLHETIRGALQVMHRDFFDDENPPAIPSQSLEDVFHELKRSYDVDVHWLIVNTDVVNVDHQARNEFEQRAVKALDAGKTSFEESDEESYHYAGAIRLASQCLKCHVKTRTSTDDRTAGLVISMPLLRATAPKTLEPTTRPNR